MRQQIYALCESLEIVLKNKIASLNAVSQIGVSVYWHPSQLVGVALFSVLLSIFLLQETTETAEKEAATLQENDNASEIVHSFAKVSAQPPEEHEGKQSVTYIFANFMIDSNLGFNIWCCF